MNLITKRILFFLAGLLLLMGLGTLLAAGHLPPALVAGLFFGSSLVLLAGLLYAPTGAAQATATSQNTGLQHSFFASASAPASYAGSIVDYLDEGLLLLDENRLVSVANPAVGQLLGLPASRLVGQAAGEIAAHSDLFDQLLRYLDAPTDQRPAPGPVFTITQGPEKAHYQLLVRELTGPGNAPAPSGRGTLLVLRNVTEHKKLDQVKWQFLAKVSQELQASLASMQLSLQRLQDGPAGPLTPEQHNITYTLTRENKHLLKLVGELLSISRLELGTIQLNFQTVRLPTLAQFVAATIGPQLQPKRLVLDVHVPADLPAARADLEKTTWVLLSLLNNAIRYAHLQDHLHIRAQLASDGQHLRVSVQDQGPGIAPADQARIFQRFSQIPTQGGSGLGLSIAREFVAGQGGEMGVESDMGKGSTFWFTLPVAGPAAA